MPRLGYLREAVWIVANVTNRGAETARRQRGRRWQRDQGKTDRRARGGVSAIRPPRGAVRIPSRHRPPEAEENPRRVRAEMGGPPRPAIGPGEGAVCTPGRAEVRAACREFAIRLPDAAPPMTSRRTVMKPARVVSPSTKPGQPQTSWPAPVHEPREHEGRSQGSGWRSRSWPLRPPQTLTARSLRLAPVANPANLQVRRHVGSLPNEEASAARAAGGQTGQEVRTICSGAGFASLAPAVRGYQADPATSVACAPVTAFSVDLRRYIE